MAKAPRLTYRFLTLPPDRDYSFPNYVIDEIATIRAIALPTFPITKADKLRIAVSLDGGKPKVLDYRIVYYGAKWRQHVNAAFGEISPHTSALPKASGFSGN